MGSFLIFTLIELSFLAESWPIFGIPHFRANFLNVMGVFFCRHHFSPQLQLGLKRALSSHRRNTCRDSIPNASGGLLCPWANFYGCYIAPKLAVCFVLSPEKSRARMRRKGRIQSSCHKLAFMRACILAALPDGMTQKMATSMRNRRKGDVCRIITSA